MRGKRLLEEDVEILASINLDESDATDDELTSIIWRSKEEYDRLQKRKGTESSNKASENSQLAMVSGDGAFLFHRSIEQIPTRISIESFLWMANPSFHPDWRWLGPYQGLVRVPEWNPTSYSFRKRTRGHGVWRVDLYVHDLLWMWASTSDPSSYCSKYVSLSIGNPSVDAKRDASISGTDSDSKRGRHPTISRWFLALYYSQENSKDHGHYLMYPRWKWQVVGEIRNADRYGQDHNFFMLMNEKLLGALANTFFPLWGPFHKSQTKSIKRKILHILLAYLCSSSSFYIAGKELRKLPLKTLLFDAKLKRLLAQPNREWDEINIPYRFQQLSL